ncbi:MAG: hypothetical protein HYY18_18485 [Planctomycetes bacterium]|nr:hypothetical protein [Planctomycetota bacterium]
MLAVNPLVHSFLHAVHPLFFIGIVAAGVGAYGLFKLIRTGDRRTRAPELFFLATGVFLIIFTGKDLVFGSPAEVAAFREADPARVQGFAIAPVMFGGQPSSTSLTSRTVIVTDRPRVERLVALLRSSTHAAPNHPEGRWMTELWLYDDQGRHDAIVSYTSDGIILRLGGSGVGHDFRQEELKAFLEEVAREKP